jgi:hypothetical protein
MSQDLPPDDHEPGRTPDAYEAEFMADGTPILARDKVTWPLWFYGITGTFMAAFTAFLIYLGVVADNPLPALLFPLLGIGLQVFLWLMIASLRVTVTKDHVHVHYGLLGPKIPVKDIVLAEATKYHWMQYGGWGIRYSLLFGWAYNVLGDKGKAVKVHYKNKLGVRKVLFSSAHPNLIADAIQRARRMHGHDVGQDLAVPTLQADIETATAQPEAVAQPEPAEIKNV